MHVPRLSLTRWERARNIALWIAFILFVVDFPPQDLDTCLRACLQR